VDLQASILYANPEIEIHQINAKPLIPPLEDGLKFALLTLTVTQSLEQKVTVFAVVSVETDMLTPWDKDHAKDLMVTSD
jgi:hypothetical protein